MSVTVFSAGSLRVGLEDVTALAHEEYGIQAHVEYGPSGLLRERIEAGERPHLLASADMHHPTVLWERALALPPISFVTNTLCLMLGEYAQPPATAKRDSRALVQWLLDDDVRLATSTPKLDPSGDYAWDFFRKADGVVSGAFDTLTAKAVQAVGGRNPEGFLTVDGLNPVSRLFLEDKTDVFVGYTSSARLVAAQAPKVRILEPPIEMKVNTTCGMAIMPHAHKEAYQLACLMLSQIGKQRFIEKGFR